HAGRIRTPVDIVAEVDDAPIVRPVARDLGRNHLVHQRQAVEPAVNVADRIKAHAVRGARVEEMDAGSHSAGLLAPRHHAGLSSQSLPARVMSGLPHSAMVMSSSLRMISSASVTPRSPPAPSP